MSVRFHACLGALFLVMTTAAPAWAQSSGRTYRGVFGGGLSETEQSLAVTGSLGAGYESDIAASVSGDPNSGLSRGRTGGAVGIGSGSMVYSMDRGRVSMSAMATSSGFYYLEKGARLMTQSAGASQSVELSRRTTLTATENFGYQPFNLNSLFPASGVSVDEPPRPADQTFAGSDRYLNWGGALSLGHQVARRMTVAAGYGYQASEWSATENQTFQNGYGTVSYVLSQGLALRLGYNHSEGRTGPAGEQRPVTHQTIDAGVDFNRTLSFSRRTTLSFSTGTTAVRDREQTHFEVTGQANLNHQIGRSWTAAAGYARSVQFLDQLQETMVSDSVSFSLNGLLNRRLSMHAGSGVAWGNVGYAEATDNSAYSSHATIGLTSALGRFAGLSTDYTYYYHSFGTDVVLPVTVNPRLDRQSVRVYVTLWAPLLTRTRSSNATR